tara:strand:- start:3043 stop:3825 length:783 start_codon:yes stop_codon:yes gene_type:complete
LKKINNITIIGSGNVATQLGLRFFNYGFKIDGIYSKNQKSGEKLARKIATKFIYKTDQLPKNSDLYLVALKDDHYLKTLEEFDLNNNLIVHTSGSLNSEKLNSTSSRWGCLYPLQSINKAQKTKWENVIFFIEAKKENDHDSLIELCKSLQLNYRNANSKQRKKIHIAAVATNNFTYHLLSTIRAYCEQNEIDYNDFKHLLDLSTINSYESQAFSLQTGPAIRKDTQLIKEHLNLLKNNKNLKEIYELFTKQITNQHHEL